MSDPTLAQRRDTVIQAALDYMEIHSWYEPEDEDTDRALLDDLYRLYDRDPDLPPTPATGVIIVDTGVTLALRWEDEQRCAYERALPVWVCDCGAPYKRDHWLGANDAFYTITDDGLFDQPVGSLRGKRGLARTPRDEKYPTNNGSCPACARPFKTTIERQANPQMSLILG